MKKPDLSSDYSDLKIKYNTLKGYHEQQKRENEELKALPLQKLYDDVMSKNAALIDELATLKDNHKSLVNQKNEAQQKNGKACSELGLLRSKIKNATDLAELKKFNKSRVD